ncbi:MAG: hypothetical protein RBT20_12810, partial [Syntrophales bacterium]|nr:hypothetical protein [Syntrophales bacterium]
MDSNADACPPLMERRIVVPSLTFLAPSWPDFLTIHLLRPASYPQNAPPTMWNKPSLEGALAFSTCPARFFEAETSDLPDSLFLSSPVFSNSERMPRPITGAATPVQLKNRGLRNGRTG